MPHLVILYTPDLDRPAHEGGGDMSALCRSLANTMSQQIDDAGKAVFPLGGIRVLAYPAAHHAVADGGTAGLAAGGSGEYAFVYLNLRMGRGRPPATIQAVGQALEAVVQNHFADLFKSRHIGVTFQIDEGPELYDAKNSSIHPLFRKPQDG